MTRARAYDAARRVHRGAQHTKVVMWAPEPAMHSAMHVWSAPEAPRTRFGGIVGAATRSLGVPFACFPAGSLASKMSASEAEVGRRRGRNAAGGAPAFGQGDPRLLLCQSLAGGRVTDCCSPVLTTSEE